MPKKRFSRKRSSGSSATPTSCSAKAREIAEVVKALGITDVTYYRWRQEFGGMTTAQAKRLQELERENGQLRRIVADLTLDKRILQEAAKGNF